MNPELLRNAWIEATPRRLIIMALVLGLVFAVAYYVGAAGEANRGAVAVFAVAGPFGLVLLVLWGARNAAEGVLGEIKDRTWDFQRLSALSPLEMTIGKLFGPTLYVWFGGVICVAVMVWAAQAAGAPPDLAAAFQSLGAQPNHLHVGYEAASVLLCGVLAQAVALGVALMQARGAGGRIGGSASILAILAGLGLVWAFLVGASIATFVAASAAGEPGRPLVWWGLSFAEPRPFLLASLAAFAAWACVGAWRLMRRELQLPSTPFAFLAFAVFLAVFAAGFWATPPAQAGAGVGGPTIAALAAYVVLHGLALGAGFLEPKNPIDLRRFAAQWRAGGLGAAYARMPAYVIGAALALGAALMVCLVSAFAPAGDDDPARPAAWTLAAAGFLIRDLALIVTFALAPGQRRATFAALVALGLLYGVGGAAAAVAPSAAAASFFLPTGAGVGVAFAWAQAAAALYLLRGRWLRHVAPAAPAPPTPIREEPAAA